MLETRSGVKKGYKEFDSVLNDLVDTVSIENPQMRMDLCNHLKQFTEGIARCQLCEDSKHNYIDARTATPSAKIPDQVV